jgi:hypothetical protein
VLPGAVVPNKQSQMDNYVFWNTKRAVYGKGSGRNIAAFAILMATKIFMPVLCWQQWRRTGAN